MNEQTAAVLAAIAGRENVREKEHMSLHTTMEVGGPAAFFVTPETEEMLIRLVRELRKEQMPFYILGKGSNVICRDQGYEGVVLCLSDKFCGYRVLSGEEQGGVRVLVKAGTANSDFSDAMIREGLAGFEFASGIPGSIGGAVCMNAGAYDGEIQQIVQEVKLLDQKGQVIVKSRDEMEFGYRHSLASAGDCVILEAIFLLRPDEPEAIRQRVQELTEKRKAKQPLEYPSCGSTFKRPEGYFAGKLISDAGLKGYRLGGAQVSEKHAGFVINRDHASARDVLALIDHIKEQVYKTQGVMLECEVRIL